MKYRPTASNKGSYVLSVWAAQGRRYPIKHSMPRACSYDNLQVRKKLPEAQRGEHAVCAHDSESVEDWMIVWMCSVRNRVLVTVTPRIVRMLARKMRVTYLL